MKAHSANSGLPRAENIFARKLLQPASEFLTGQKLASISLSQAQTTQVARKKNAPRGAHFFIFSRNLISSEAMKAHSVNSGLPRAENLFTRKFLQPAFEFLAGKNSLLFLYHRLRQTRLLDKKNAPRGAHFFIFSRNFISSEAMKAHSGLTGSPEPALLFRPVKEPGLL